MKNTHIKTFEQLLNEGIAIKPPITIKSKKKQFIFYKNIL